MKHSASHFIIILCLSFLIGAASPVVAGSRKRKKSESEEARRRRKNAHKAPVIGDRGKRDDKAYDDELEKARERGKQQALAISVPDKTPIKFVPTEVQVGKEMSWTGTLSKEMVLLEVAETAKETSSLVLTTADGTRVILTAKSLAEYSLTGSNLLLQVGQEVYLTGIASARRVKTKTFHVVSRIKTSAQKKSAMFDDLGE